jgi:hypothetical protein
MSKLLYKCMTKATTTEGDNIRYSLNWVFSRRGFLQVFADHLECGNWVIPYSEIQEAVLVRTRQMLIPGYVLRVKARGQIYQFGLNPSKFWTGELPFRVTREESPLSYSWFSIVIRVAAIAMAVYLLWNRYR